VLDSFVVDAGDLLQDCPCPVDVAPQSLDQAETQVKVEIDFFVAEHGSHAEDLRLGVDIDTARNKLKLLLVTDGLPQCIDIALVNYFNEGEKGRAALHELLALLQLQGYDQKTGRELLWDADAQMQALRAPWL